MHITLHTNGSAASGLAAAQGRGAPSSCRLVARGHPAGHHLAARQQQVQHMARCRHRCVASRAANDDAEEAGRSGAASGGEASFASTPAPPATPAAASMILSAPQHAAQPATESQPQPQPQAAPEPAGPSGDELKAMLLDSLYGTERGLNVSSELRGEISELITQLEAANPSETPNDVEALSGEWKLVYTSNSELWGLLALSRLPFVTVGDITQTIDGRAGTVTNKVQLMDSFTRSSFSSTADFEVRSPKLLNIKFVRGALATPQLLQDVDLPETISVMGQTVDLSSLKSALAPARSGLQNALSQASSFLRQQPDLAFDIPEQARAESWLLTTFLDEDTRVARGDGGSVFVLVKEPGSAPAADFNGGAWKDDPLRKRGPVPAAPPPQPPGAVAAPAPVTPPAMNIDAQLRGGGDLESY